MVAVNQVLQEQNSNTLHGILLVRGLHKGVQLPASWTTTTTLSLASSTTIPTLSLASSTPTPALWSPIHSEREAEREAEGGCGRDRGRHGTEEVAGKHTDTRATEAHLVSSNHCTFFTSWFFVLVLSSYNSSDTARIGIFTCAARRDRLRG